MSIKLQAQELSMEGQVGKYYTNSTPTPYALM
jgi:hypothetical protein